MTELSCVELPCDWVELQIVKLSDHVTELSCEFLSQHFSPMWSFIDRGGQNITRPKPCQLLDNQLHSPATKLVHMATQLNSKIWSYKGVVHCRLAEELRRGNSRVNVLKVCTLPPCRSRIQLTWYPNIISTIPHCSHINMAWRYVLCLPIALTSNWLDIRTSLGL
jgi:hypothetical protein